MGLSCEAECCFMSQNDDRRCDRTEIVFRRRALQTNCGIHARRNGPALLSVLSGAGIRARYIAQMEWLGSEADWREADARRIGELAAEIRRFGHNRAPAIAETCDWHAARLRELVSQHAVLRQLESRQCSTSLWPEAGMGKAGRRRSAGKSGRRR
jgi:hypothetical protein